MRIFRTGMVLIVSSFMLLLNSCTLEGECNCLSLKLKTHFLLEGSNGEDTSYIHYVYVEDYCGRCRDSIDEALVQKYLDTCAKEYPVEFINFISSVNKFGMDADYQDWDVINDNVIKKFNDLNGRFIEVKE